MGMRESDVSLTDLFRGFSEDYKGAAREEPFPVSRTLRRIGQESAETMRVYTLKCILMRAVCESYGQFIRATKDKPINQVYDFLAKRTDEISAELVSQKKINGSMLDRKLEREWESEIERFSDPHFVEDMLPTALDAVITGRYRTRIASMYDSLHSEKPSRVCQDYIDLADELKSDTESLLRSCQEGYSLIPKEDLARYDSEIFFDTEEDMDESERTVPEAREEFLCDRILRIYLLIDAYSKVCGKGEEQDSESLCLLLEFLGLRMS